MPPESPPGASARPRRRGLAVAGLVGMAAVAFVVGSGLWNRNASEAKLKEWTDADDAAPTQEFVLPKRGPALARTTSTQRDGLWDANDVARYLKVSRSWVYHRAEAGHLSHLRIGGLLRFDPAAIRAFASKK